METVGSKYGKYEVTKIVPLKELKCTLKELVHVPTGAHIVHIDKDDSENVFCLSFQTLPNNSNGVAHILEHTVLCGSMKFPIKDPFFSMNRRSLNTFMNALTGPDFTCYPAATQLKKDFYNLLEVYIDAVFHPNLNEYSFKQEGHRLEFEVPEDVTSPLSIRGIVYNEMKGAMNSGHSRMHEALYQALFPDIVYGINSGGNPKVIPTLSYKELVDFHHTYYHPSRCLFYFYGNFPLKEHLDFISHAVLDHAKYAEPLLPIALQPRFTSPRYIEEGYPISSHENVKDKSLISFGWLTCYLKEQETCLALSILEIILLDTDASPLKKAFLKSGLCKQVSSCAEAEISEVPFVIQLGGCNPESAFALEKLLFETLSNIAKKGISNESVENAIHQLEFYRSEITGDYYPFGLTLFMRSCLLKQHGGDPEHGLLIHSLFDKILHDYHENPNYFTDLIDKYLLKNPHFVRVTLFPDPELEKKENIEERNRLDQYCNSLTDRQKHHIVEESIALKTFQASQEEESTEVLPKVHVEDIPKKSREISLKTFSSGSLEIYFHDCFTNEILYADIFLSLPPLNRQELLYSRLLTIALYQVGSAGKSYEETLENIQAHTGGISPYLSLNIQAHNHKEFFPTFGLRGKALYRNTENLCHILKNTLTSPNFKDPERLKEILHKHYTNLEHGLTSNALKYAVNLSASALNEPSYLANLWYGLDYFQFVKDITFNQSIETVIENLENLKNKIFFESHPELALSCDKEHCDFLHKNHFFGLENLPARAKEKWTNHFEKHIQPHQGRIIASPVAFIAKAFNTVSYVHPDAAALNIAAFLFDNLTLHRKIREEGGAYGGGALSNVLSGNFYFYSYRDPHIASSLKAFEEAIQNIVQGNFDEQDLEEAQFEMIQQMDSPISPGSRAVTAHSWLKEGRTQEIRQAFRNSLLSINKEKVIKAVEKHIQTAFSEGATIALAGKELLEKENATLRKLHQDILPIKPLI